MLKNGVLWKENYSRVVCADGYSFSAQASNRHYCIPEDDNGPYTHIEIGYPDNKARLLIPYRERRFGAIYGRVPVEVVDALIAQHGGIAEAQAAMKARA